MKYEVVSPLGEPVAEAGHVSRYFDTLNGKTVCMSWNDEFRGHITLPIIGEMLQKRYPGVKVVPYTELPLTHLNILSPAEVPKRLEAWRVALKEKGCDAVISAQGG
ncbi:hypothetical protein ACFLTZ_04885 [Chloroflexota bacterium]